MLTVGSLFSGIGGIELGLEWTGGFKTTWQVEIDEYARRVLEKHWPNVQRFADIKECGASNLVPVDLICGGFPCQDISDAGLRAGLTAARSGLWGAMAGAIRVVRPRYALVENVAAILHRGMGTVLGDLAALGHDAEWDCLPTAAFGARHIRDRVFITSASQEVDKPEGFLSWSKRRHPKAVRRWMQNAGIGRCLGGRPWSLESGVARTAYGVSCGLDRRRCLGNAVVPQVARYIGERILEHARRAT